MTNTAQKELRLAVVGAGTTRQGTGPWLCRFADEDNCKIEAVLGRNLESATAATKALGDRFGIQTRAVSALSELSTPPDLVVIASPAETHEHYLRSAIELNVPIFCEKPFIYSNGTANDAICSEISGLLDAAKLPFWLNTQWNRSLDAFRIIWPDTDLTAPETLLWEMSPGSTGPAMVVDALPHAIAMLLELAGPGHTDNLKVSFDGDTSCRITWTWIRQSGGQTEVRVHLKTATEQPRPFAYAINGARVDREIDMDGYKPSFRTDHGIFPIKDPLQCQIAGALHRLRNPEDNGGLDPTPTWQLRATTELLSTAMKGPA